MAKPWTPDFEMRHFERMTFHQRQDRHRQHAELFQVEETIDELYPNPARVIEVGCGGIGGMLSVYSGGTIRMAIDPLAKKYYDADPTLSRSFNFHWLEAFAHSLPISDGCIDVAFCLEALDHCKDEEQFQKSQRELARVLRPNGLLFFMVPARADRPQGYDGHPCNPPGVDIRKWFEEIGFQVQKADYPKEGTWLLLQKS